MQNQRPELLPFILSGIAVIGIIVLTALSDAVPDILNTIAVAALVGAGAIAMPGGLGRSGTTTTIVNPTPPVQPPTIDGVN